MKKLGNIPDGGGWRYVGRRHGEKHRAATPGKSLSAYGSPKLGYSFVHTVLDDHSRVAFTEVHDDETAATSVGVLCRAVEWFAKHGVTIERAFGQWRCLSVQPVAQHLRSPLDHAEAHAPLPASDQRQGRALPSHHGRRLGVRSLLHQRAATPRRSTAVAAPLQPAPATHRLQQPARYLVSVPDNGDSRWSRYGLLAL